MDQAPWAEVKREMVSEKGLTEEVADKIGQYVGLKGELASNEAVKISVRSLIKIVGNAREVLSKLESDAGLMGIKSAKAGLEDMKLLFDYLEVYGALDKVIPTIYSTIKEWKLIV